MSKAYIAVGCNVGSKQDLLRSVEAHLKALGSVSAVSSGYWNGAEGFQSESLFLNAVVCIETEMKPESLLQQLLAIEHLHGRSREGEGYSNRSMDLDLLAYDGQVIETPDLQVPHPRLHERAFVLIPMLEVCADWVHPILKKNLLELLVALK